MWADDGARESGRCPCSTTWADAGTTSKRWRSHYILVPPRPNQQRPYPYSIPAGDKALQTDAAWLQDHTTRRK